jgi:predicted DsbA family dithiol-disulfide isomerase
MFARVESAARESGIPLDLSKLRFSFPTVRAHALLRHAGPKGTQSALAKALFRAYFLDGRNISDLDVLVPLGAEHGFESDEASRLLVDERELQATRRDAEEARRSGIRGVPFYVLNERVAVSGAQPESVFRNSLLMPEGG